MELAAQRAGDVVAELPADVEEQRITLERLPVIEANVTEAAAVVAIQRDDRCLDDRDAECLHTREPIRIDTVRTVAEQDNVVGPLAQQDGEVFAAGVGGEDGEPLVADCFSHELRTRAWGAGHAGRHPRCGGRVRR